MADQKSKQNPHKWPDGSWHSIPWTETRQYLDQNRASFAKPGELKTAGPNGFVTVDPNSGPAQGNEVKIAGPNGTFIPVKDWNFGYGAGVPGPDGVAPTGTPAGPAKTSTLPVDPIWQKETGDLAETRDKGLFGVAGARTRGLTEYGFKEGAIDPASGETTIGAFDPQNPFSRASMLKKAYDASRRGTGNQMAAGGQLYSGAYQNAQDQVGRNQLGSEDTLQKSLIAFLTGNTGEKTQLGTNYNLGMVGADARRLERAPLLNPLYDPTAPPTAAGGAAPTPAPAAPAPLLPSAAPAVATGGTALTPGKTLAPVSLSLSAGPGIKGTKTTRKGRVRTYTNTVKGP